MHDVPRPRFPNENDPQVPPLPELLAETIKKLKDTKDGEGEPDRARDTGRQSLDIATRDPLWDDRSRTGRRRSVSTRDKVAMWEDRSRSRSMGRSKSRRRHFEDATRVSLVPEVPDLEVSVVQGHDEIPKEEAITGGSPEQLSTALANAEDGNSQAQLHSVVVTTHDLRDPLPEASPQEVGGSPLIMLKRRSDSISRLETSISNEPDRYDQLESERKEFDHERSRKEHNDAEECTKHSKHKAWDESGPTNRDGEPYHVSDYQTSGSPPSPEPIPNRILDHYRDPISNTSPAASDDTLLPLPKDTTGKSPGEMPTGQTVLLEGRDEPSSQVGKNETVVLASSRDICELHNVSEVSKLFNQDGYEPVQLEINIHTTHPNSPVEAEHETDKLHETSALSITRLDPSRILDEDLSSELDDMHPETHNTTQDPNSSEVDLVHKPEDGTFSDGTPEDAGQLPLDTISNLDTREIVEGSSVESAHSSTSAEAVASHLLQMPASQVRLNLEKEEENTNTVFEDKSSSIQSEDWNKETLDSGQGDKSMLHTGPSPLQSPVSPQDETAKSTKPLEMILNQEQPSGSIVPEMFAPVMQDIDNIREPSSVAEPELAGLPEPGKPEPVSPATHLLPEKSFEDDRLQNDENYPQILTNDHVEFSSTTTAPVDPDDQDRHDLNLSTIQMQRTQRPTSSTISALSPVISDEMSTETPSLAEGAGFTNGKPGRENHRQLESQELDLVSPPSDPVRNRFSLNEFDEDATAISEDFDVLKILERAPQRPRPSTPVQIGPSFPTETLPTPAATPDRTRMALEDDFHLSKSSSTGFAGSGTSSVDLDTPADAIRESPLYVARPSTPTGNLVSRSLPTPDTTPKEIRVELDEEFPSSKPRARAPSASTNDQLHSQASRSTLAGYGPHVAVSMAENLLAESGSAEDLPRLTESLEANAEPERGRRRTRDWTETSATATPVEHERHPGEIKTPVAGDLLASQMPNRLPAKPKKLNHSLQGYLTPKQPGDQPILPSRDASRGPAYPKQDTLKLPRSPPMTRQLSANAAPYQPRENRAHLSMAVFGGIELTSMPPPPEPVFTTGRTSRASSKARSRSRGRRRGGSRNTSGTRRQPWGAPPVVERAIHAAAVGVIQGISAPMGMLRELRDFYYPPPGRPDVIKAYEIRGRLPIR